MSLHRDDRDFPYLTLMDELLTQVFEFAERAREAQDDVTMGAYLRMMSRTARCALEVYGDHLAANHSEMKQGEQAK